VAGSGDEVGLGRCPRIRGAKPSDALLTPWDRFTEIAIGDLGWTPAAFWGATFHDFTAAIWRRKQQAEAQAKAAKGERAKRSTDETIDALRARARMASNVNGL
jgi:hypothetical protein